MKLESELFSKMTSSSHTFLKFKRANLKRLPHRNESRDVRLLKCVTNLDCSILYKLADRSQQ